MPVVEVTLAKGVFSNDQKQKMASKITDAISEVHGSEDFKQFVVVLINELDGYYLSGEAIDAAKVERALHSKASM